VLPRLKDLAAARPRYGYRGLHALLPREGHEVNVKRVRRLCVLHGLKLVARGAAQASRDWHRRALPCGVPEPRVRL
jgi:hypothetical protein